MQKSFKLGQLELEAQLCEDYINQDSPGRVANFSFTFNALQKSLDGIHKNEALQAASNDSDADADKESGNESSEESDEHDSVHEIMESTKRENAEYNAPRVQQLFKPTDPATQERDKVVDRLLQEYRESKENGMAALDDDDSGRGFFANVMDVSYNAQLISDSETNTSELTDVESPALAHGKTQVQRHEQVNQMQSSFTALLDQASGRIGHTQTSSRTKRKATMSGATLATAKRPHTRSRIVQEMIESEEKELTFRPKINQAYTFAKRRNPDVLERLEEWDKKKRNWQTMQQDANDDKKEERECTFRPKISSQSNKLVVNPTEKVTERFDQHEQTRTSRLAKARKVIEKKRMQECTFKPILKTKRRRRLSLDSRPIWERWKDDSAMMNESKARAQAIKEKHMSSQCTFTPKVNAKSRRIAQRLPQQQVDVTHRLSHHTHSPPPKSNERSFQPQINPNSEKIVKILGGSFLERQEMYQRQTMSNKAKLLTQLRKKARRDESFKPNVGNSKKILENSNRHRHRVKCETATDFYERLSVHDVKKKEQEMLIIKENLSPEPEFKPKINKKSKKNWETFVFG